MLDVAQNLLENPKVTLHLRPGHVRCLAPTRNTRFPPLIFRWDCHHGVWRWGLCGSCELRAGPSMGSMNRCAGSGGFPGDLGCSSPRSRAKVPRQEWRAAWALLGLSGGECGSARTLRGGRTGNAGALRRAVPTAGALKGTAQAMLRFLFQPLAAWIPGRQSCCVATVTDSCT